MCFLTNPKISINGILQRTEKMILHQLNRAKLPIYLAVVSVNTRPRPDSATMCYFLFFVVSTITTAAQQETTKTIKTKMSKMGATTCNVLLGEVEAERTTTTR